MAVAVTLAAHFLRRRDGVGESGIPEAREVLLARVPGLLAFGLALGIAPQGLRQAVDPEAAPARLVAVPAAKNLELTARLFAIQVPHPISRGLVTGTAHTRKIRSSRFSLARRSSRRLSGRYSLLTLSIQKALFISTL